LPIPFQLLYDFYPICLERDKDCSYTTIVRLESIPVGDGEGITAGLGDGLGMGGGLEPLPVIEKLSVKEPVVGTNCIVNLVADIVNLETP